MQLTANEIKKIVEEVYLGTARHNGMFEDELPEGMPKADYEKWYKASWIPGGVGCRFGPIYPPKKKRK